MIYSQSRILALLLTSALLTQIISPIVLNTYALNTTYHVDATLGDDANTGGFSDPWRTLTHVSSQNFSEGDQILLKCGETWNDTLSLDDSGVSGNQIVIGAYGTCSSTSFPTLSHTGGTQIQLLDGAAYIKIEDITFAAGTGVTMSGADNVELVHNRFTNTLGTAVVVGTSTNVSVMENYFQLPSSILGVDVVDSNSVDIISNTFSGGRASLDVRNSSIVSISDNTFYNPETYAVSIVEDTSVPAGTVNTITMNGNTILTWNPAHPMIRMDDQNSANGTLANVIGNIYINVYKSLSPLIEILQAGSSTITYTKNDVTDFDANASTFLHFGYSSYNADGNPTDTKLFVNTGATSVDRNCNSSTMVCSAGAQVGIDGSSITFPTSVPAYDSKIILWNNPSSIQNPPTCSLNATPGGSIPNGGSVEFTWNVTNSLSNIFSEPNGSGGTIDTPVGNSGSGVYFPPGVSSVNRYTLTATNNIGPSVCAADIVTQNNAPTPSTFFMTGSEDGVSITGTLVATDQNGDDVTFSKFPDNSAQPANGTLTIGAISGLVTYTPNADFCGEDTFEWRAADQNASSDPEVGTITVLCSNDTPVAVDDELTATGGQVSILHVTLNDIDPDSAYEAQTFTVSGITLPSEGTLVASGSVFEYTANLEFIGIDTFTYILMDQSGAISNTGTVTVNVVPGQNIAPVVSSGSRILNEDDSLSAGFSGSDINGDALSFSAVTLPAHGTLTITGSGFSYVPNAHYNGLDSFNFVANDGQIDSNIGTISLQIDPVMDTPVAVDDTVNVEMNVTSDIDVLANDTDADNPFQPQTLTLTGITSPTSGTASIVANQIRYTPNALYLGSDTIEYVIQDQDGNISNTGTVSITVSTTNQPPTTQSGSYTLDEDTSTTQTLSGSDPDMTDVTFVLDTDVTHGTLTLSSTGEFIYIPDADYHGTDSFTFHVTDGIFDSAVETVTFTIVSVNDAPVAVDDSFTVNEDTFMDIVPMQNDSDIDAGDIFSLNSVSTPLHGSAVITGSLIRYTPVADYCGQDTFEYTIIDQSGATSALGDITMNITCINDAPLVNNASYTTTGNILTQTGNIFVGTLSGSDIDVGDVLSFTIIDSTTSGSLILTGSTFTYEPMIDFVGEDTFTYVATDASGAVSNTGTITMNVLTNDYNAPPVAYSGTFSIDEDAVLQDTLSGSDIEGDSLTYILDTDVTHGILTLSSTGEFTYIPDADYHGTDSFTFHVSDGESSSSIVTVDITINSINDAPVAVNNTATGTEDLQIVIDPTLNDTDIDGDTFSLHTFSAGTHGAVTASGNTITYSPTLNYCGADSVEYTIIDTALAVSNTGTINITLTCVNDAPTATGDTVSAVEDTPLLISVLTNDSDVDVGDSLSIANLTQPSSGGTVSVSGTGVMFTPTANFCISDPTTFTYQARDTANALSAITTVTIDSISCLNDTPTSNNMTYTLTGNTVINSGTILSGGILSGYLATTRSIAQTLAYIDIDGDTVVFSGTSLPLHGTGVITATGLLTYMPNPGYIGTDSMTFVVSDASTSSTTYTITFTILDPNPPVYTPPVIGPGGGGGGGSAGSYINPSNLSYTPISSAGTNTGLTSQLLLTNPSLPISNSGSSIITGSILTNVKKAKTYQEYIVPIIKMVDASEKDSVSSADRATAMRQSGQKLLHIISRSLILSNIEKVAELESAETDIVSLRSELVPIRESRALDYIIRLVKRERSKIQKSLNTVTYFISL